MIDNLFQDRADATNQLIDVLPYENMKQNDWIIIATSAGAIPIASEIANKLVANFDFIFTQKINAPKNNECEIAIITETKDIIIHEELMKSFGIKLDKIYKQADEQYNTNIKECINKHRNNQPIIDMKNQNILFVDEGLNTGLTMMACIKSAIHCQAKSIAVAVPVLPRATIKDIESIADDLYYVKAPSHFITIDFYYDTLDKINLDTIQTNITNTKEYKCQ